MSNLSPVLIILAGVLLAIVTTTLSLKIVVWGVNSFVLGTDPGHCVPAPSLTRSLVINAVTFTIVAAMIYGTFLYLDSIPRPDSNRIGNSVQWCAVLASFIVMMVAFLRFLPTTLWRAFLVAALDFAVLSFMFVVYGILIMMYAYKGYNN